MKKKNLMKELNILQYQSKKVFQQSEEVTKMYNNSKKKEIENNNFKLQLEREKKRIK